MADSDVFDGIRTHFGRHLVIFTWFEGMRDDSGIFLPEGLTPKVASGTLIRVEHGEAQLWGILTAGHVFQEYEDELKPSERESDNHRIWDGWTGGESADLRWLPFDPFKYPYAYQWKEDQIWKQKNGVDMGVVLLPALVLRSLAQRMVGWANSSAPENTVIDGYLLLGEPLREDRIQQYDTVEPETVEESYVPAVNLVFVEQIEEPEEYHLCPVRQFFGHIGFPEDLPSIGGMSGGPIFAAGHTTDGKHFPTWPIAIQSRWNRQTRNITATPFDVAYDWACDELVRLYNEQPEHWQKNYLIDQNVARQDESV